MLYNIIVLLLFIYYILASPLITLPKTPSICIPELCRQNKNCCISENIVKH